MARANRRPTFWRGTYIDDATLPEDALGTFEIATAADLEDEQNKEPTLVRVFGRIVTGMLGELPIGRTSVNVFYGLTLGGLNDPGLADPRDMTDDRWLWTGMTHNSWVEAMYPMFTSAGVWTAMYPGLRAYPGPWEMLDFESHAMRKSRDGDSLLLRSYSITTTGNPVSLTVSGLIRSLWKAA